jgi:hypothetical protein
VEKIIEKTMKSKKRGCLKKQPPLSNSFGNIIPRLFQLMRR